MVSGRGKREIGETLEAEEWSGAAAINSTPTSAFIAEWRPIHQLQMTHDRAKLRGRLTEMNDDRYYHHHHHDGRMKGQRCRYSRHRCQLGDWSC